MQSLEYGFSQFHEKIKPKAAIVLLNMVDSEDLDKAHSRYKNEMAKVFMHCKEYAELSFDEKVNISGFGVHCSRGAVEERGCPVITLSCRGRGGRPHKRLMALVHF